MPGRCVAGLNKKRRLSLHDAEEARGGSVRNIVLIFPVACGVRGERSARLAGAVRRLDVILVTGVPWNQRAKTRFVPTLPRVELSIKGEATAGSNGTRTGHWGEGVTADDMKEIKWLIPKLLAQIKVHGMELRG
jgi:hypothetical protein